MKLTHADKRAVTLILPAKVWGRVAEISQSSGVPRNAIAALGIEYWLRRFIGGEPVAHALASRAEVYDSVGERRELSRIAQHALIEADAVLHALSLAHEDERDDLLADSVGHSHNGQQST